MPGGRIHPHQRDTDDVAPILGQDLGEVSADFSQLYHETLSLGMDDKCRKNYRARLARIANFWKVNNENYYSLGVRDVSNEDLANVTKFYFGRYKTDLIYQGINVEYVLHFLISVERRKDGKLKSFQDIRKYRDAILWGAKVSHQRLPTQFFEQIDSYLAAYKKKIIKGKKTGEVDEHGADPISVPLYERLLQWAIESNNVFVWFWTICQWNFMARSASIDPLAFHNFTLGTDSIIGKYDDSKADKTGDRLSEKNLYANPEDWRKCFWTGLGVYVALHHQDRLAKNERLFLSPGTKEGTAATRYCEQLMGIVGSHEEEVSLLIRLGHMNPYGLRKGAATHAVSGTTAAPSIPSIARRGEWSLGAVLDVYWHFAKTGDEYLGRVLAGLDPNDVSFALLPPHWTLVNPMENEHVKKAMTTLYGVIMESYRHKAENPTPMLLRCLACIVFHSDKLLEVMVVPGHDFSKLAILHDRALLVELKKLVTTAPTPGVMTVATGIPPHIGLATQLKDILATLSKLVCGFEQQSENLISALEKALDEKAWDSGNVTGSRLKEILDAFHGSVNKNLDGIRVEFKRALEIGNGSSTPHHAEQLEQQGQRGSGNMFAYGGRFYAVPQTFKFPTVTLREAIRFWVKGQTVSTDGRLIVRPFRKLSLELLPQNLKPTFKTNWTPIFKWLEAATNLPADTTNMSDEDIDGVYNRCVAHLKAHVSYCWNSLKGGDPLRYTLGTWSNKISRASITKHGTDEDKAKLQEASNRHVKRRAGLKRKTQARKENILYPLRQKQRYEKLVRSPTVDPPGSPRGQGRGLPTRREQQQQQTPPASTDEEAAEMFDSMIAQLNPSDEERAAAAAMIAANVSQFEQASRAVRRAGVDDDGNPFYLAPNTQASTTSSTDPSYVENLRATLNDGVHRGRCSINPCFNAGLPLHRKCDGMYCNNYVHRTCASGKKGLYFGSLGDENERVYCRRDCKPLQGSKRVGYVVGTDSSKRKEPPVDSTTAAAAAAASETEVTPATTTITMTRVREEKGGQVFGHCSIVGCKYPEQELNRHHCSNCGAETHNLCAQDNNLCDDDREHLMYCSMICKQTK